MVGGVEEEEEGGTDALPGVPRRGPRLSSDC